MYKTYFSILLHFGIFHRVGVGQKRLKQDEHNICLFDIVSSFRFQTFEFWFFSFYTNTRVHIHTHTHRTRVVDIMLDG